MFHIQVANTVCLDCHFCFSRLRALRLCGFSTNTNRRLFHLQNFRLKVRVFSNVKCISFARIIPNLAKYRIHLQDEAYGALTMKTRLES